MFLAPNFFRGAPPEFLDLHYKIGADTDYCAKFRGGDWLAEFVDLVVNLKKHHD